MTIFHATSPGQPQKSMDLKYLLAPSRTPFLSFWSRTCSPAKQGGTSNNSKKPGSTWESPLPDWKYETQKPDIRGEDEKPKRLVYYLDTWWQSVWRGDFSSNRSFCWEAISFLFMFCGHLPWHVFLLVKHWRRTSMIKTFAVCSARQTESDFCQSSAAPCGSFSKAIATTWHH